MHYPIDIKRSLKTCFTFRICVGLSAKCSISAAKRAVERFTVIGMDVAIFSTVISSIKNSFTNLLKSGIEIFF